MIIFPMAGLSSRFRKAGYDKPKYMLPAHGRSLFAHAVSSFRSYFEHEAILFICLDVQDTPTFVRSECEKLGLKSYSLVTLSEPTSGQAETVYKGIREVGSSDGTPMTVFNIDTFRPDFHYPSRFDVSKVDGYLEVFRGEGDHWSFAEPAEADLSDSKVIRVTEKNRISDLCSTGLYYFRQQKFFTDAYEKIASKPVESLQGGERYIAPLYNDLIAAGLDIRYEIISSDDVIFCGIPSEYDAFLGKLDGVDW